MMTIYTANGSQYSINQTTHTITGKHMNPLHFYGTPDVRLGFPAYFHTDRGTWRTSAVMKIENGPAHVYKLFSRQINSWNLLSHAMHIPVSMRNRQPLRCHCRSVTDLI